MFRFLFNLFKIKKKPKKHNLIEGKDYEIDKFDDGAFIVADSNLSPEDIFELIRQYVINDIEKHKENNNE